MNPEAISSPLLHAFIGFEAALRRLNPLAIPELRNGLLVHVTPLEAVRESLLANDPHEGNQHDRQELLRACDLILDAIKRFGRGEDLEEAFTSALRAARKYCQAQEALFPLCGYSPEVSRYFAEPGTNTALLSEKKAHIHETHEFHTGAVPDPYARGGYSLFIPEIYTPERTWPLVVALHGGNGHGRDFIWTWLREARSRGFVLLAPTSLGPTWSILNAEVDAKPLSRHLEEVYSLVNIDRSRILLTGMSDGGTFALAVGVSPDCPYQAIAPVSCVLPPADMGYAKGRRLFWVHGAQDWMFPVSRTVQACQDLARAGADINLKIVHDLAHAYPREENDTILRWFDPDLTII